jgi:hypothetical protein
LPVSIVNEQFRDLDFFYQGRDAGFGHVEGDEIFLFWNYRRNPDRSGQESLVAESEKHPRRINSEVVLQHSHDGPAFRRLPNRQIFIDQRSHNG